MVQIQEFDLIVGDILRVGGKTVTVIDIDQGEVTFRIDEGESHDDDRNHGMMDVATTPLPR